MLGTLTQATHKHALLLGCSRTELLPDGITKTGVFVSNLTAEELQTLWAKQPLPFRTQAENNKHRQALQSSHSLAHVC